MDFPSIAEQLRACGIEVPHRRVQENVLCPFHPERHPSFSVAHDKQLFFDFHTGEGGNRYQLAKRLKEAGFDLSKLSVNISKGTKYNRHLRQAPHDYQPTPPDNEVLAVCFEKMGLEGRAERVRDCAKYWGVSKCIVCGTKVANPFNCASVLCDRCRQNRLKVFTQQHQQKLTEWGGCKVLRFLTAPREQGEGWESEAERVWDRLQKKLPSIWKQLKRKGWLAGWLYHKRFCGGDACWAIAFYFFVPLKDDQYYDEWFLYLASVLEELGFGFRAEEVYEGPFGAIEALRTIVGAPFGFSTWRQFALLYRLTKGKKLVQGGGDAFRVSGGMAKGRKQEVEQVCPVCGGEMVFLAVASWELIHWSEGGFWTCDENFIKAVEDQAVPFVGRPEAPVEAQMVNARLPFKN